MIKIVDGAQRHAPIIRDIALQTWPHTFKNILSLEQIIYMLQQMYAIDVLKQAWRDGHQYLLAKEDGAFVGFLTMQHDYCNQAVSKIHKLYVLPEAQGKGIGKALLEEAEKAASKHGSTTLVLNVNRLNKATDFYERCGFSILGEEDIDIGEGYLMEDFIMSKQISVPAL